MSTSNENTPLQAKPSYVDTAKTCKKYTNEQAIIIERTAIAEFDDYLDGLTQFVSATKILVADFISKNRLIVFLDSKQTAEYLTNSRKSIIVANQTVHIRPYVTKNKRVTFSHVLPQISDEMLEKELIKLGIKIASPIVPIKPSAKPSKYGHITGLKRQTFVTPTDVDKLPSIIEFMVEENSVMVFATVESSSCYICKQEGHIARSCPNKDKQSQLPSRLINKQIERPASLEISISTDNFPPLPNKQTIHNSNETDAMVRGINSHVIPPTSQADKERESNEDQSNNSPVLPTKRPHPPTPSPTATFNVITQDLKDLDKSNESPAELSDMTLLGKKDSDQHASKKLRGTDTSVSADQSIESEEEDKWNKVKELIEDNTEDFPLNITQFTEFMEDTRKADDIVSSALKLCENLDSLRHMIDYTCRALPNRALKNRATLMMKEIDKYIALQKSQKTGSKESTSNTPDNC